MSRLSPYDTNLIKLNDCRTGMGRDGCLFRLIFLPSSGSLLCGVAASALYSITRKKDPGGPSV